VPPIAFPMLVWLAIVGLLAAFVALAAMALDWINS
jgi:hypothetical protein